MTARAAKSISNESADWEEALAHYRGQLQFYVDYLLQGQCGDEILTTVEEEVRERTVPDEFKSRFLVRALVRSVIQHLRQCAQPSEALCNLAPEYANSVATLRAQERLVYFMRDILEYSTRDSSLLMGITDAQVEKLLALARKRIDMTEGPSSVEIETPQGAYFRWRFVDLHPS
jgi:DNA-directed RNA polymerase specialized sigma24 family protein